MKKQILVLLTIFLATVSVTLAQAPNLGGAATCPAPTPINTTCIAADALHPIPGTPYDYEVNVPTPTGTKYYDWFVTQDMNFITTSSLTGAIEANNGTGAHIQATGTGYNDPGTPPTPGSGTNTINITWKSFVHDATAPVFLVIYVKNEDGCTTDNIQVYIIEPRHAFTLDIANIGIDGSAQANLYGTCVSPIFGAQYNVGTGEIEMDYGVNYIFFIVNAANYTESWLPSFQIGGAGIAGTRVVTAVDWAYPADAQTGTWQNMTGDGTGTNWTTTTEVVEAQVGTTVGSTGECIIVRVTVDNNKAETITDAVVSLAVDGVMLNPATNDYSNASLGDIHYADCTIDGFTNDVISQTLTARPDIQDATTPPAGDDFVPQDHD